MRAHALHLALTASLSLLALSCSYAPSFQGGVLACGVNNDCPKGYACASDGACWKSGTGPSDADPLAMYVGTWTFESGSLDAKCSDGDPTSTPLSGGTVTVTEHGNSLTADYYCGWVLHRVAASTAAVADPGQSCQEMDTDTTSNIMYTYTWHGNSFSFDTADGLSAMVVGHVSGPFTASDGSTGSCDGSFSGSLTLSSP